MTPSGPFEIDTNSAEFQPTVDMGVAAVGTVSFRTTLLRDGESIVIEDSDDPVISRGGMQAEQYLTEQEQDAELAAEMARVRQHIAKKQTQRGTRTLRVLRRRAGLSQTQLAQALGTKQPNIARWERDPSQMTARSIQRMATALCIKEQEILDAMPRLTDASEPEYA